MPKIGNLFTTITADASTFETNFKRAVTSTENFARSQKRASKDVRDFERTVQQASKSNANLSRSSGRGTRVLLELSRGAEDAAVSFGTTGLAGALRGAQNNLSQAAAMMTPMAGVVVGLASAVGSALVSAFSKLGKKVDEANLKLAKHTDLITKFAFERRRIRQDLTAEARIVDLSAAGDVGGLRRGVTEAQRERAIQVAEAKALARQRNEFITQFAVDLPKKAASKLRAELGEQAGRQVLKEGGTLGESIAAGLIEGSRKIRRGEFTTKQLRDVIPKNLIETFDTQIAEFDSKIKEANRETGLATRREEMFGKAAARVQQKNTERALAATQFLGVGVGSAPGAGGDGRIIGGGNAPKPLTASQILSRRLRINAIESQLRGRQAGPQLQGPNTAAVGGRAIFAAQNRAARELARAQERSAQEQERQRLEKERNEILRKILEDLKDSLPTGNATTT